MNFSGQLQTRTVFKIAAEAAHDLGVEAYVVGGYVRDLILQRPNKDIDFVCVGSGIEWAQRVGEKLGSPPVTVFKNFGRKYLFKGFIWVEMQK